MANRFVELAESMEAFGKGHPGSSRGNIKLPGTWRGAKSNKPKAKKTKTKKSKAHARALSNFMKNSGANYSGNRNYDI